MPVCVYFFPSCQRLTSCLEKLADSAISESLTLQKKVKNIRRVICTSVSVYIQVGKTMQAHPSCRNHNRPVKLPYFHMFSPSSFYWTISFWILLIYCLWFLVNTILFSTNNNTTTAPQQPRNELWRTGLFYNKCLYVLKPSRDRSFVLCTLRMFDACIVHSWSFVVCKPHHLQ